jgi:hypothetical protein
VLINLTHFSVEWCTLLLADPLALPAIVSEILSLSNPAHIKREGDEEVEEDDVDAGVLDRQCLALALLTNIVFGVEEAKESIRDMRKRSYASFVRARLTPVSRSRPILPARATLRPVVSLFGAHQCH